MRSVPLPLPGLSVQYEDEHERTRLFQTSDVDRTETEWHRATDSPTIIELFRGRWLDGRRRVTHTIVLGCGAENRDLFVAGREKRLFGSRPFKAAVKFLFPRVWIVVTDSWLEWVQLEVAGEIQPGVYGLPGKNA
jgi:hypothetical protein